MNSTEYRLAKMVLRTLKAKSVELDRYKRRAIVKAAIRRIKRAVKLTINQERQRYGEELAREGVETRLARTTSKFGLELQKRERAAISALFT